MQVTMNYTKFVHDLKFLNVLFKTLKPFEYLFPVAYFSVVFIYSIHSTHAHPYTRFWMDTLNYVSICLSYRLNAVYS